jgi:hypothetical protein
MADFDGEYIGDTIQNVNYSTSEMAVVQTGWYSQTDPLVVITNHYHKRGWRTESNAYVEWESTDRNTPYPGGGTVEPVVGTVIYQWVTYSNGQLPP